MPLYMFVYMAGKMSVCKVMCISVHVCVYMFSFHVCHVWVHACLHVHVCGHVHFCVHKYTTDTHPRFMIIKSSKADKLTKNNQLQIGKLLSVGLLACSL